MTTRTDVLQIRLETDGAGKVKASLAGVEQSLGGIEKKAGGVSIAMLRTGAAIATAIPIGVAGMAALTANAITSMARIDDLTKSTGASAEAISEYGFVAEQSGTTIEVLADAWSKQSRNVAEAAAGYGTAKDALKALGIDAKALADLAPEQQFEALADTLASVEDPGKRAALAFDLWGTNAKTVLQTIDGGAPALRALRDEARALGVTVSTEAATAAGVFDDNLAKLKSTASGLGIEIANKLLPSLVEITDRMVDAAREGGILDGIMAGLNETIVQLAVGPMNMDEQRGQLLHLQQQAKDADQAVADLKARIDHMAQASPATATAIRASWVPSLAAVEQKAKDAHAALDRANKEANAPKPKTNVNLDAGGKKEEVKALRDEWDAVLDIYEREEQQNNESWARQKAGLVDLKETGTDAFTGLNTAVTGWASNMSSQLTDMLFEADTTFEDILRSFMKMITQMIIQQAIVETMLGAFGFKKTLSAHGNAFSGGRVMAFASGGTFTNSVVSRPTYFDMGVMGEAGPEAIMPLKRTRRGDLGVVAEGGGSSPVVVQIYNNQPDSQVSQRTETGADGTQILKVFIDQRITDRFASGSLDRLLNTRFGLRPRGA